MAAPRRSSTPSAVAASSTSGPLTCVCHRSSRAPYFDFNRQILLSSGAHVSRYLVQAVVQHVCRKSIHFVKGQWARTLPFPVFAHFLHTTSKLYPSVDVAKGEDDGSLFLRWVQQHKSTSHHHKAVSWDKVVEMFEHGFMPFCPKVTHICSSLSSLTL